MTVVVDETVPGRFVITELMDAEGGVADVIDVELQPERRVIGRRRINE